MNIGEAAQSTGVSAKMIRHYERIGLIEPAGRTASGYRIYGEDDLHALRFIRRARQLGFSLEETQRLLLLWKDRSRASAEVKRLALRHLRDIEERIAELEGVSATLRDLLGHCRGDRGPACPIIEELAAPTPA
jgi:Cu(I)-responsive transcriptional regulator